MQRVKLQVNGVSREAMVEPQRSLLHLLRDELGLVGTKEGCSTGYCGACTVLVDREPVNACLFFAVDADHKEVTTIEGLALPDGTLHPLQTAMMRRGGLQCGFCTPGVVLSALALLLEQDAPDELAIRRALAGNLCRCTGYQAIVQAVLDAACALRERDTPKTRKRVRSRA
jgi:aerobic carbon-monoxide dehydrogenase small subunit